MKRLVLLTALLVPTFAAAYDYTLGDIVIAHPVAFETAPTAMSGAGYMTVTNTGETDDRLIAIEGDFPRVMMHETKTEDDVATMMHMEAFDVPAGETVSFAPGGKHIMFMGLNGDPFEVGEEIEVTLTFEKAGTIDIVFNVESRNQTEKTVDHSGH